MSVSQTTQTSLAPIFNYGALKVIYDLNRDYEFTHASWSYNSPNHTNPDSNHKLLRFYMNEDILKERGIFIPTPAWSYNNTLELVNFTITAQDGSGVVHYEADGLAGISFRDACAQGALAGRSFVAWKVDVADYDDITGLESVPKVISFLFREAIV
jgi:hypothetical protein